MADLGCCGCNSRNSETQAELFQLEAGLADRRYSGLSRSVEQTATPNWAANASVYDLSRFCSCRRATHFVTSEKRRAQSGATVIRVCFRQPMQGDNARRGPQERRNGPARSPGLPIKSDLRPGIEPSAKCVPIDDSSIASDHALLPEPRDTLTTGGLAKTNPSGQRPVRDPALVLQSAQDGPINRVQTPHTRPTSES